NASSTATHLVLDLKVGTTPLTAFGFAMNLAIDPTRVTFSGPTAAAIDPGASPAAAKGSIVSSGPLKNMLALGIAKKKTAVADGDDTWAAGAALFSFALDIASSATPGAVFSGPAARAAALRKDGSEAAS